MTLAAAWCNYERENAPSVWMASDSRISAEEAPLIDEGIKIYELPVICRVPGQQGFFDEEVVATSVGIAGAGSSLVFQHVAGTLVPILSNLISLDRGAFSIADVARLVSKVTTLYVRSVGVRRPAGAVVTLVVAGQVRSGEPEAYKIKPERDSSGLISFPLERLDLGPGKVHFIGDKIEEAEKLLAEIAVRDEPGASRHRAALNVIRQQIDDPAAPSIGGDVQVGFTVGGRFHRYASFGPDPGARPRVLGKLNSIDLDDLGTVGPWTLGVQGMVVP